MKRYKRLTRKQKEQLTRNDKRLNVRNWWFRSETGWKKVETLRDYDRRVEDDTQAAFLMEYAKKKQVCKKDNPFFLFKRKEKGL